FSSHMATMNEAEEKQLTDYMSAKKEQSAPDQSAEKESQKETKKEAKKNKHKGKNKKADNKQKPHKKGNKDKKNEKNHSHDQKENDQNSQPKHKPAPDKVVYKEGITVAELAKKIHKEPAKLVKDLFMMGVPTNQNQSLGSDEVEI